MTDRYERTREPAEGEGRAITAVQVMLFGRACYLPADIAQEVEQRLEAAEKVAEASRQLVSMYERATGLPCPPQIRRALAAYDNLGCAREGERREG